MWGWGMECEGFVRGGGTEEWEEVDNEDGRWGVRWETREKGGKERGDEAEEEVKRWLWWSCRKTSCR